MGPAALYGPRRSLGRSSFTHRPVRPLPALRMRRAKTGAAVSGPALRVAAEDNFPPPETVEAEGRGSAFR